MGDLLGAEVVSGGSRVGRLHDLAVRLDVVAWPVVAARIRSPAGDLDLPWSCVRTLEADRLDVLVPSLPGTAVTDVAWLASTVLDHELIDVEGKRVVRVGDVILDRTAGGLAAVGVEIGAAAVLRRVGLRRLAARLSQNLIPVSAIHPPGALHTPLTLETSRARLASLEAHELAGLLDRLPHPVAGAMLETLEPAHAARTRHHLARRHATRRARRRLTNFHAP